uniref:Uncharacterized protein n=1 Tax=Arundo donax TaxID=35708 RepID=A0A0A9AHU6_ARUDO
MIIQQVPVMELQTAVLLLPCSVYTAS